VDLQALAVIEERMMIHSLFIAFIKLSENMYLMFIYILKAYLSTA